MEYNHNQALLNIIINEINKLPEHIKNDIFSSEKKFIAYAKGLGFQITFQSTVHYGVHQGADMLGQSYDNFDLELDTSISDTLMEGIKSILAI